jgi:hypothetical protein
VIEQNGDDVHDPLEVRTTLANVLAKAGDGIRLNEQRLRHACKLCLVPKTAQLLKRPIVGGANVLQYLFAQNIGVAFTCFGKRDELRGDCLFDAVVAVSGPQTDADHFERNA